MMIFHPLCLLAPKMTDEEFRQLVENIRDNGYDSTYPVVLYDGLILDGRHRYLACKELNITPVYTEWKPTNGDTPEKFVTRSNVRRHMTVTQRAAFAVAMGGGGTIKEMADAAHVSPATISQAKKIAREKPELIEDMISGEITMAQAANAVEEEAPFDDAPIEIHDDVDTALRSEESFKAINKQILAIEKQIEQLAASSIGGKVRMNQIATDLKNVRDAVRWAIPYKRCPYKTCKTTGCKACGGAGWVIKDVWANIPSEIKGE